MSASDAHAPASSAAPPPAPIGGAAGPAAAASPAAGSAVSASECGPAAEDLARAFLFLGKRWTAMILGHLSHGPTGFRDLSRGIGGISDSVLSARLTDLTSGGLITRSVREGPPVTVTYQLTERGEALMPALDLIAAWARDNLPPDAC
jgi:DNA-binding HxlR family transcriptional regulator